MALLASTVVLTLAAVQAAQPAPQPNSQSTSQAAPAAAPMAEPGTSGDAREIALTLPHVLRKGESAWLLVEVGAIGHNEIQLTTKDGRPLGAISPFAIRSGQPAGIYTVPVPAEALSGRRLALRLSVTPSGGAQRAPTGREVKSVRLVIRRFRTGS